MESDVNLDNLKLLRSDLQHKVRTFQAGVQTFQENYGWTMVLEAIFHYLNDKTDQTESKLRAVIDEYGLTHYKVFY